MRKKYLSALLFGALVMASTATFTSCKDYDDDIDQVNTDINAVKSDLSSKMDAVNTSISGLTSAQSEIKSSLSAVNKQIETLSADGAKAVAALKDELQKADADQKAALEAKIAELNTQLEEQVDALAKQAALLSAQDEQIAAILADLEATKAQIVTVSTALEEKIAQNVTDIETLNEITATLSATVDANMAEVVGKITAMETVLTNHNVAIESILVTLDGIDGQIAAIKALAGDNTAAIETLKADIETLKQEMEEKIVASHDAIRAEISKVDSDLNARIDKLTETVLAGQASMMEALANQTAALELQKTALEEYKAAMEAADLDRDGKIGDNAETIAANKEAADKAIADLSTLLETEVKGLNDKIDALDDRIKALEAGVSEADWQTIKKEIEDANKEVTTAYEKADKALEKKIEDLQELLEKNFDKDLNTLKANVSGMITNVSFVLQSSTAVPTITFTNYIEKETKFGYDVNGNLLSSYITFTKDVQRPIARTFEVRVTPASAVLDASRISFLNSKGEVMPNVSVTNVVRRENTDKGYISRAAAAPTGIWEVTVQLDNYNASDFNKATLVDPNNGATTGNFICYAMSISNPVDEKGNARNVTTAYDMAFKYQKYSQQNQLWFNVGDQPVSQLQNRASYAGVTTEKEYTWKITDDNNVPLTTVPAYVKEAIKKDAGAGQNTVVQGTANALESDNRTSKALFSAAYGVPFTVSLTAGDANTGLAAAKAAPSAVRAIYVTLDKEFAVDSTPSEWEAWNTAFSYTGLNQVVEGTSTQITINSANAVNDIIGFRVYAVNYDGTLVDPDGKAFYVYVGNNAVAQADLTIGQPASPFVWTSMVSEKDPFSTANWGEATNYTISFKEADGTPVNASDLGLTSANFKFFKNNNGADADATLLRTSSGTTTLTGTLAADKSVVTKVQMVNVVPVNLKDGMTYTATITAKNSLGVVATGTIKFTKALPAFPSEKVYPFTNVLQHNTLTVYPIVSTSDSNYGKYLMTNVWHGLTVGEWNNSPSTSLKTEVDFVQVVTDAQHAQQNGQNGLTVATCTYPTIEYPFNNSAANIKVEAKFVNPNTEDNPLYGQGFPMKVTFDHGAIRKYYDQNDGLWKSGKHETQGENFNIVLRNYADDCTFTWNGAAPVLVYNGVLGATSRIDLDKLIVKDGYNASVVLTRDANNGNKIANGYFQSVEVHFLTGANFDRVDEYYYGTIKPESQTGTDPNGNPIMDPAHIELTKKSEAAIPGNVPTKLQFVIKDSFGYIIKKVIDVPFTMTPRQ